MSENIIISSYNDFAILAHKPTGNENCNELTVNNNPEHFKNCMNPAFMLKHPFLDYIYICYESIFDGSIATFKYTNNKLEFICSVDSQGKSSCYLTFDKTFKNIINVNYWNSTISVHPIKDGIVKNATFVYSSLQTHLAETLEEHLFDRQSEPHFHSAVFYKNILFVADLGMDRINFFNYTQNKIYFSGYKQLQKNSGPRYIRILNDTLYVINEISSNITVFSINTFTYINNINFINNSNILNLKQTISTLPKYHNLYHKKNNTCGNLLIHPNNKFIYASNRGHDSIAAYEIINKRLKLINIYNCHGRTPRHFTFNVDGTKLYVANQDSNNISIFNLNVNNGKLQIKKTIYCKSPNFILIFN